MKIAIFVFVLATIALAVSLNSCLTTVANQIGDQYCADAVVRQNTAAQCQADKTCVISVDDKVRIERDKRLCK